MTSIAPPPDDDVAPRMTPEIPEGRPAIVRNAKRALIGAGVFGLIGGVSCAAAWAGMSAESGGASNYDWALPGLVGVVTLFLAAVQLVVAAALFATHALRARRDRQRRP